MQAIREDLGHSPRISHSPVGPASRPRRQGALGEGKAECRRQRAQGGALRMFVCAGVSCDLPRRRSATNARSSESDLVVAVGSRRTWLTVVIGS